MNKNLVIFSDGSFCFEFNIYNLRKVNYATKDLKKYQSFFKNQFVNIKTKSNYMSNYRKKLFK